MTGLTNEEVQERIAQGQVNNNENPNTRTYKQIILENTLTFFNFLNLVLLVLVLLVGSYKNSMFVGIIFINTVIGIIQEVRAKKTIDKLAILTESKTVVLREGKKWKISTEKLVVDDLIFLRPENRFRQMRRSWREALRSMNPCLPVRQTIFRRIREMSFFPEAL